MKQDAMADVAAYYNARGWPVLPLPPGAKFPPPDGTTGSSGRDLTLSEVQEALAGGGNLGLRMPDGVVGLDVDAYVKGKREKKGADTILRAELKYGALPDSPRLTSRSDEWSGIRFYRVPAGVEIGNVGPDVDTIRRSHRYAVAAPSVHPDGARYRWLDEEGRTVDPPAVADLPWLPEAWIKAHPARAARSRSGSGAHGSELAEIGQTWLDALPADEAGAEPCANVAEIAVEALQAATRRGPTGGARNDLLAPLLKLCLAAEVGCVGARSAIETAGTAYRGLTDGADHEEKWWHLLGSTVDRLGGSEEWQCAHYTATDLRVLSDLASTLGGASRTAATNTLGMVDWSDSGFWSPPAPREFVPGMLLETQVGTIYSPGGLGKSLLALDIAVGLTVRGTIFGQSVDPASVLYIDREQSTRGLLKRLLAMGVTHSEADALKERLHYSLLGALPPLDTREGGETLVRMVRASGARFVVIDTLSKVVNGEENANDTWNGVHAFTMVALKAEGVTVLQIDHTGKDKDKGQRGGSAKQNNADVIWRLEGDPASEVVTLVCEKDRDGDFGGVGTRVSLIREERPLLHRVATEAELLSAGATAYGAKEAEVREAILSLAESLGGEWTQNRMMTALKDHGISARDEIKREMFKALKEEGRLTSKGAFVGVSDTPGTHPDTP